MLIHKYTNNGYNSYNGPIEFELINSPDLKEPLVQVPSRDKDKLYEFQEFQSKANDIFNTVNKDETDTPEHNNSSLPMKVTIYASNIPNLNLLDISGSSQPELFKKSLVSPSTIIFAVQDVSENSDTTVSDIYRKYDPLGRRTVGILTHNTPSSDKDAADTTNLLDRSLLNHIFSLHLGYVELDHFKDKVQQQQMLRHKLISVLEQAMGRSIYTTVDSIKRDLEETSYSFKVEYNDREITAYSYLTDSMDQLKFSFKEFAGKLGKPQLRREVRSLLEQNVLDVCAEQYWSDAKITELVTSQPDDFYWLYKIDLASAAITKSGIGRITTQLVIDVLMNNMKQLVKIEPLEYHPQTQKRVIDMTADLLRSKFIATSDQVENTIKPFKYEVIISIIILLSYL